VKHLLVLSLLLLPACTQYQKRSFEIYVKNETPRPISVGLVKNGPPTEEGWIAPHEVAVMAPQLSDRKWGLVLNPGQSKTLGPYTGQFQAGVQAILRIYVGTPTIDEMIAFSRSDPERLDIYLWPGKSGYVIRNAAGKLEYERAEVGR
jgi:hypothetical protein